MKLSAKGRTAVTAIADLASQGPGARVSLSDIAVRQGLSLSFLEQVFADLRRAGIVTSKRGPKGGYALASSAEAVRIADVIEAVDEPIKAHGCKPGAKLGCTGRTARCLTHSLWGALEDHIEGFLAGVSVQDVIDGRLPAREMEAAK